MKNSGGWKVSVQGFASGPAQTLQASPCEQFVFSRLFVSPFVTNETGILEQVTRRRECYAKAFEGSRLEFGVLHMLVG